MSSKRKTMTRIKEHSTNQENKKILTDKCPGFYTLQVISGQWVMAICDILMDGKLRFAELKKKLPGITEKMLTVQLRNMENNKLIKRTIYAEVPPRVEYELTESGLKLEPIIRELNKWGLENSDDFYTCRPE